MVKQQEHEYVTSIKDMVANNDTAAIRGLLNSDWSVTYLIIAASHLCGDAKAVGQRISTLPASARRGEIVNILLELAARGGAPADSAPAPVDVPAEAPVPFDDPQPAATTPATEGPAPRRRRRAADAIAEATGAAPAARPGLSIDETLRVLDFDRAFGDVLGAVAQVAQGVDALTRDAAARTDAVKLLDDRVAALAQQLDYVCARLDVLAHNAALFRNGVLDFEQELAMNGVIGNAVFSEAVSGWRE